ncbi:MAG: DUF2993 domain-containing protein [Firmicutes bacterium]|nr:DUF2993 domain-containing protein [Bacillota bacterium]
MLVALTALFLLVALVAQYTLPGYLERRLGPELGRALEARGPTEVRIRSSLALELLAGRFDELDLEVHEAVVGGVELERVAVSARGLRLNLRGLLKQEGLTVVDPGTVTVNLKLSEEALNRYFWEKVEGAKPFRIDLSPDAAMVAGTLRVLGLDVKLFMRTRVEIRPSSVVALVPVEFSVGDKNVPRFVLRALADQMEFALDFSSLPIPMQINEIRLQEGSMLVFGGNLSTTP